MARFDVHHLADVGINARLRGAAFLDDPELAAVYVLERLLDFAEPGDEIKIRINLEEST